MLIFTKDFNSCKTVGCDNFGVSESDSYVQKSERLGYLSTECTLCGSNPPWINNELVRDLLSEKLTLQFGQKVIGCKKCSPYFFISDTPPSKLHGFTSAGTQRKKCSQCGSVFTRAEYKNVSALKSVLAAVIDKKEVSIALKESALPARLFYFYLNKLASIFSNFSRLNEQKVLQGGYLGMHSEGRLLNLNHQRGIYSLFTAEIESGYVLLQTNNLSKLAIPDDYLYDEVENTMIVNSSSKNIESVLLDRYQSNLKRNHFEQLIVGNISPITKCNAFYPDKVAYVHFQLLKGFTVNVQHYDHYLEHESTLRSAALMSSLTEIEQSRANIYYFLPFANNLDDRLDGKPLGWWNDIWFSNEVGAFSLITNKLKGDSTFKLNKSEGVEQFYRYLNHSMNKNVSSMQVIDNLSEIYRTVYNYCLPEDGETRACLFGVADRAYLPEELLEEALKQLACE